MDLKLRGRTALVTGASMGIGFAVAQVLAEEGCTLHLAARNAARLEAAAEQIRSHAGVKVIVHPCDLSQTAAVEALAIACSDVDILVNNAGGIPRGTLQEIDAATWRRAWDLKVFGYIDLSRAIIARMYERGSGVIVNVIGAAAERLDPNYIAGCTGNAALNAFSTCLGQESISRGVRVVAACTGAPRSVLVIVAGGRKSSLAIYPSDAPARLKKWLMRWPFLPLTCRRIPVERDCALTRDSAAALK